MNINDKFVILKNNKPLRGLKASTGAADILKVNTNDVTEFLSFPITPVGAPTTDYAVVNKKYVDDGLLVAADQKCSGLVSWSGTGNYYSLANGIFTVLRGGVGRLSGTNKITWAGGESVSGLAAGVGYLIGYSATNTLIKIDVATLNNANTLITRNNWLTAYTDNVILFGVWTDGAYPIVVKEDHEYKYSTPISVGDHFRWGQTFSGNGAVLSVLSAANRTIQTTGEDLLSDHGLVTRIPDAAGVSINPQPIFVNLSGNGQRLAPHRFTVSGITTAPTAGAVYSHNGSQYTVLYTTLTGVAPTISGTIATWMSSGTTAPTASGTLTRVSGTGDTSVSYSSFLIPASISGTYLNAGVPTSLSTSGSTRYGIVAIYTTKDDKQTPNTTAPTPSYFQLLSNVAYNNPANAANSIGSAIVPDLTQFIVPSEFKALEMTLNGFVLCDGNGRVIPDVSTNGFIAGVKTVKTTLSTQFTVGSVTATTANNISLDTSTFTSGWLTASENNVQLMANKIASSSVNFPISVSADAGLPLVTSAAGVAAWALPQSIIDSNNSGFVSWSGTGNYYSFVPATGVFTVLRAGIGRIKGSKKTWAGGENVTLTRGKSYMITISNTNTLSAIDWRTLYSADTKTYMDNMESLFKNNILLFSIFYDTLGDGYSVMKQLHPYDYASEIASHDHFRLGHVFIGSGGLISVLSAANRTIQTAGAAALDDHGVLTAVADGSNVAMSVNCLYANAGGTLSQLQRRAFVITTGTPVAGDVYRNSGDTFRVTVLYFTGGTMHAYQSAGTGTPPAGTTTLTRVSGSGSASIIYSSWTDVRVVPSIYAPAGVPTPLATSGNTNRYGLYAIFATGDDYQTPSVASPLPNFICVPSTTAYSSTANAISSLGTAAIPDTSQFVMPPEIESLEPCLMGFVLVDGNTRAISATTSSGFVSGVRSYRNTGSGTGGAGAAAVSTAVNVSTNTSSFTEVLSATDVNVQVALNTIDSTAVTKIGAQELTNKKLTGGTASTSNEWTIPNKSSSSGLNQNTAGNIFYNTTTKLLEVSDGSGSGLGWKSLVPHFTILSMNQNGSPTLQSNIHYILDMSTATSNFTLNLPAIVAGYNIKITVHDIPVGLKVIVAANGTNKIRYNNADNSTIEFAYTKTEQWAELITDSNKWFVNDGSGILSGTFSGVLDFTGGISFNGGNLLNYYKITTIQSPIGGVDSGIATMEVVQTRIGNIVTLHIKAPNVTLYKQGLGTITFPIDPAFTPINDSSHVGIVAHSGLDFATCKVSIRAGGYLQLYANVAGSDFDNDAVHPVTFQYQSFTYNIL